MPFRFTAKIYKVGINPCVKVPSHITDTMKPVKGYISVKGLIENHSFKQTLVPVKDAPYRLFVNGPMLKGANVKLGQTVHFAIEQDFSPADKAAPMVKALKNRLDENNLYPAFKNLTPHRQQEILKYLNYLKTEEALARNIDKVITQLNKGNTKTSIP